MCYIFAYSKGLYNEELSSQKPFSRETVSLITSFLQLQVQPVCLVAHNGDNFDFKLLKTEVNQLQASESFPQNILCVDSLKAFKEILESSKFGSECVEVDVNDDIHIAIKVATRECRKRHLVCNTDLGNHQKLKSRHNDSSNSTSKERLQEVLIQPEVTCGKEGVFVSHLDVVDSKSDHKAEQKIESRCCDKKLVSVPSQYYHDPLSVKCDGKKISTKQPFPQGICVRPRQSFRLEDLYCELVGENGENSHNALNDCMLLLRVCQQRKQQIVSWIDTHSVSFNCVKELYSQKIK